RQSELEVFRERARYPAAAVSSSSRTASESESSSIKPKTSCGIGALHTGANDRRWSGEGPCSRRAARWRGVQYPLFEAKPYMGNTGSQAEIIRSRSTFAIMDAAAIDAESASP